MAQTSVLLSLPAIQNEPLLQQDISQWVDCEIGQRIFLRRKQLRLSQSALGAGLGVSFQQIQKYERGSNRVSTSALYRIAMVLGVPMSYFFETLPPIGGDASSTPQGNASQHLDFAVSAEGQRLVKTFLKLPRPLRSKFISMLDTLNSACTIIPPGD